MAELGCITEQGAMGFGFTPVTDAEYDQLREDLKEEYNNKSKKDDSSDNKQ